MIALLRQRGRVAYRTLKRQFQLDDEALDDLKIELIESQRLATDEQGTVLVWTGAAEAPRRGPAGAPVSARNSPHWPTPRPIWGENPPSSKTPLEDRHQEVVLFFLSKARWNSWRTATRKRPARCSIRCWNA